MSGEVSRREFVKAGVAAGLTLAVFLDGCGHDAPPVARGVAFVPNAWIRIGTDDTVTVIVDRSEMGQGVSTALPMLVAEELEADWSTVRFEFAPANDVYANPLSSGQLTGGSTSIRAAYRPLREAAARARVMLVAAAAARWGVQPSTCRAEAGTVLGPDGKSARYGALAEDAARQPVPAAVSIKRPGEFRLIGTPVSRLDLPDQVTGRIRFGIDSGPPDALTAVVARCPVFGGTLRSVDRAAALAVPGVRHVVEIGSGVAVVGEGYWAAKKGRDALKVEWDEGDNVGLDDAAVSARLTAYGNEAGYVARTEGRGAAALSGAAKTLDAVYEVPFLAHATMEPMNCTADARNGSVTVWAPTQFQSSPRLLGGGARGAASMAARVPIDRVTLHTTNLGGGFGRRFEMDFVTEACEVSRAVQAPVKVIWSREDDIRHDQYRPAARHQLRAALDGAGAPVAWDHHVISQSIMAKFLPGWLPDAVAHLAGPLKGGVDANAMEGATDVPYGFPNLEVRYTQAELGVPVGFWRSVAHSHTAFAVECFIDELAELAGQDPLAFRRTLLAHSPRNLGVLNLAAEKAGWDVPPPAGRFRGLAVHESFGSHVAQVAEVSLEGAKVRVHRVVCAVDCGQVINPDTVAAQMEGGIIFGLTAALQGRVTLEKGRIKQSNFHDYRLLTMRDVPVVEVHIVPSTLEPGGVGEPGTPPIAPAVANAVFRATGKRVRKLPIEV